MPKSRVRRRSKPATPVETRPRPRRTHSPRWLAPLMLVCFALGVLWLAAYYISSGDAPVLRSLGGWNLLVGFGFILAGFGLATQWR